MNANELVVSEWLASAQDDLSVVSLTAQVPLPVPTCYHCGQSIEKMLKAYIIVKENKLIKTHDLDELLERCVNHSTDFSQAGT